jgi:hypothetical protein
VLTPELATWLESADADRFPYDEVIAAFHRVGKQFVPAELLQALAAARQVLPAAAGGATARDRVGRFLQCALDKADGRYEYRSYLALTVLGLPDPARVSAADMAATWLHCDRLLVHLVCDIVDFELAAAGGATDLLPRRRPDARTVAKRCRLALRATEPALHRLGLAAPAPLTDPVAAAGQACRAVRSDATAAERDVLRHSMLPVHVTHEEYLFIRVLQSFEVAFTLTAVRLGAARDALADGAVAAATGLVAAAAATVHESYPLFSLMATMQVEAFREFRTYTDGASAIQSRTYKLMESTCREPDPDRLGSIAYRAVPDVRALVRAGMATLDGAVGAATAAGLLNCPAGLELEYQLRRFAAALLHWRRTHYRLAARMLDGRPGTGYTEGPPYLERGRSIPVFRTVGALSEPLRPCPVTGLDEMLRAGATDGCPA